MSVSIYPSIHCFSIPALCWSLSSGLLFPNDENTLSQWVFLVPVFTAPLSDVLLSAIIHSVCHPSINLRSLSSHLFLFSTNSPSCIVLSVFVQLFFPDCFISLAVPSPNLLFCSPPSLAQRCYFFFHRSHLRNI